MDVQTRRDISRTVEDRSSSVGLSSALWKNGGSGPDAV